MAVGDGANDLQMLATAGLGIAWRAKEKVQREAPHRLNGERLDELMALLGPWADEAREDMDCRLAWQAEQMRLERRDEG